MLILQIFHYVVVLQVLSLCSLLQFRLGHFQMARESFCPVVNSQLEQ